MEGLPKHRSWKRPKLASTGLCTVGAHSQALPGWDTLGTSAGHASTPGQLEQDRGCAPLHPGCSPTHAHLL